MKKKTLIQTAIAATLSVAVMAPTYATHTPFWIDSYGGFIDGTQTFSGAGNVSLLGYRDDRDPSNGGVNVNAPQDSGGNGAPDVWSQVSWGTAIGSNGPFAGKSGLETEGIENLQLDINGAAIDFGHLTHYNEPISTTGGNLNGIDISWNLDIYADPAQTTKITGLNFVFDLDVWETLNQGSCPNSAPMGTPVNDPSTGNTFISDGTPSSTCDDAFHFTPISGLNYGFSYEGEQYEVIISGFYDTHDLLTDTFWSGEGTHNVGHVLVRAVPEPTSIALMGLGLLGLGFAARRRR